MKKKIIVLAIGALSCSLPAHAGTVSSIISGVVSGLTSKMTGILMPFLSQNFSAMTQSLQSEINRGAVVQKNTAEAIATWQAEDQTRRDLVELSEKMQQPKTTCQAMATADAVSQAEDHSRRLTAVSVSSQIKGRARSDGSSAPSLLNTSNAVRNMIDTANYSNTKFGKGTKFENGDVKADLLFMNADDQSDTYAPEQEEAVNAYIDRLINPTMPPEKLRDPNWEKTEQGKAYMEMVKNYAAIKSLSAASLHSIKAGYVPKPGLGAQINQIPGVAQYTKGKNDISMMDAIAAYVSVKSSPESIRDLSTAKSSLPILRDMATTGSFRLWIEHNSMRRAMMSEAILAAQLSMAAESMRPNIEAQRLAAQRAGG